MLEKEDKHNKPSNKNSQGWAVVSDEQILNYQGSNEEVKFDM